MEMRKKKEGEKEGKGEEEGGTGFTPKRNSKSFLRIEESFPIFSSLLQNGEFTSLL